MKQSVSRPAFLLQGDSLTQTCWQGWGAHLADTYQRRADVISRGYGGYTSRLYLHLPIDKSLEGTNIELAILWLGANDQALPGLAACHVPVKEYQANLKILVQRLREDYQCRRIMLVGPPPIQHEQRLAFQLERYGKEGASGQLERTMETAKTYNDACQKVAQEESLPFLSMYHAMLKVENWDRFFCDGLHFTPPGHEFVGQTVVQAIVDHYPELEVNCDPHTGSLCNSATSCEGLPNQGGPFHDDVDHANPSAAFKDMI